MNSKEKELMRLRKRLDEHFLRDYHGLSIEDDTKVAQLIQRAERLAGELGEESYQEPQKHWS